MLHERSGSWGYKNAFKFLALVINLEVCLSYPSAPASVPWVQEWLGLPWAHARASLHGLPGSWWSHRPCRGSGEDSVPWSASQGGVPSSIGLSRVTKCLKCLEVFVFLVFIKVLFPICFVGLEPEFHS